MLLRVRVRVSYTLKLLQFWFTLWLTQPHEQLQQTPNITILFTKINVQQAHHAATDRLKKELQQCLGQLNEPLAAKLGENRLFITCCFLANFPIAICSVAA